MCGISGVVNRDNSTVDEKTIDRMNRLIEHRGPDGNGTFFSDNFALGHQRLSILDLSDDGKQPMTYSNTLTITFNGEVYNYLELKAELVEAGFQFQTKTDTEVILAAYKHWGNDCVQHFNGMWSFVIYDAEQNTLFFSRDRFGIKPLYYTVNDEVFAFGSEIKQLLDFQENRKANDAVLIEYLISGLEEHSETTFFEGIQKLTPGCNLIYNLKDHTWNISPYYELEKLENVEGLSEADSIDRYAEKLSESVKLRMRSDVEVGTCLSGGMDSSAVTSLSAELLRENSQRKIKSIHAKVEDKGLNESGFAQQVSNHCSTEMITVQPTMDDFLSHIDTVIETQEEPFGSPSIFLQYFVLKKAREMNCLVMLDGQGGDETLLGYERYYPAIIQKKKGIAKLRAFSRITKHSKLSKLDLLKYYFYFTNHKLRVKRLKQKHSYFRNEVWERFDSTLLKEFSRRYLDIFELQKFEIIRTQLPHLLKYEDKNSMAHSVETRLPFLDYKCVELALSINNDYKVKDGWSKFILRKAVEKKLPGEVVWRREKLGFNAPEARWLSELAQDMETTIRNSKLLNERIDMDKFDFGSLDMRSKWRYFNVAKWEQIYQVN